MRAIVDWTATTYRVEKRRFRRERMVPEHRYGSVEIDLDPVPRMSESFRFLDSDGFSRWGTVEHVGWDHGAGVAYILVRQQL